LSPGNNFFVGAIKNKPVENSGKSDEKLWVILSTPRPSLIA
jgi:hypothetical protein